MLCMKFCATPVDPFPLASSSLQSHLLSAHRFGFFPSQMKPKILPRDGNRTKFPFTGEFRWKLRLSFKRMTLTELHSCACLELQNLLQWLVAGTRVVCDHVTKVLLLQGKAHGWSDHTIRIMNLHKQVSTSWRTISRGYSVLIQPQ